MTAEKPKTDIKQSDILPTLPMAPANIQFKIERYDDNEADYFRRLMVACRGNMSAASRLSGLCRATIYVKIAKYKIGKPN